MPAVSPTPSASPDSIIFALLASPAARSTGTAQQAELKREVNSGIFPSYENKLEPFSLRIYGRFHRQAGAFALVCLFMSPLLRPGVYFRPQAEACAAQHHNMRLIYRYEWLLPFGHMEAVWFLRPALFLPSLGAISSEPDGNCFRWSAVETWRASGGRYRQHLSQRRNLSDGD